MIFGTAGRAKAARLDQLEVLRVPRSGLASTSTNEADPKGGELGTVRSMISLITARSTQQTFKLSRDYSLAEDVSVINVNYGYARGGNYGNRQNRPFYLQEDIPSRIDQFVVGASELRLTQVLADIPVSGGFEGTLECDPARMRGTLENTTGLEIERPVIWYNNQMYRARVAGKTITMEDGPPYSPVPDSDQFRGNYWGYMSAQPVTRTSPDADAIERRNLYDRYLNTLFVSTDTIYFNGQYQRGGMGPGGTRRMDSGIDIPPVLVAWAKTGPQGTLAPDKSIAMQGGATIIVADIDVHWNGSVRRIWYEVPVTITNTAASNPAGQATGRRSIYSGNIYPFVNGQGPEVDIVLPPEILKRNPGNVVIKVSGNGALPLQFLPKDKGPEWTTAHPGTEEASSFNQGNYGVPEQSVCYDLADWRSYTDLATGKLSGKITTKDHEVNTNFPVAITVKVLADEPENKNEDWIPWQ